MEHEIMGKIKDKPALEKEFENKIAELNERLNQQANKVSEKKMASPTNDMADFSNEDNLNYQEYRKIKQEIENLQKQLERLRSTS